MEEQQHYVSAPPTPLGLQDKNESTAKPTTTKLFSQLPNPLATASILSIMVVHWLQPLVVLGAKHVLEKENIWPVCESDSCTSLGTRFLKVYKPHKKLPFVLSPVAIAFIATFKREIVVVLGNCLLYIFALSMQSTGANMRSLVMDLVYQKSLRLSCVARQQYSTGEVLTLMSVDTERVFTVMMESPWL
ncbi:hypothetical protein F444_02524, partial [Phytophthora nicotianae P1976]